MVMHRALFTWFILLIFVVFLLLRLEGRINWNWFFIFFPLWLYDVVLFIDAIATFIMHCKHDTFRRFISKKDNYIIFVVLLKLAAQILICLKLEYRHWNLDLHYVLIPFWLLLPILICNIFLEKTLGKVKFEVRVILLLDFVCFKRRKSGKMRYWTGWRYKALIASLVGVVGLTLYPIFVYPMLHIDEYKELQKRNRRGLNQEEIQPGNMKVWSDPFERK